MMDSQTWTIAFISHAFQVTLLAGLVWAATKLFTRDRPHVAHALWILVLLKCMMPPTWSSSTSVFSWLGASVEYAQAYCSVTGVTEHSTSNTLLNDATQPSGTKTTIRYGSVNQSLTEIERAKAELLSDDQREQLHAAYRRSLQFTLIVILIGFAIGLTTTAVRVRYFLKMAYAGGYCEDAKLNAIVSRLRKQLGVSRHVRVHTMTNAVGPVVVGLFQPTLLLPQVIVAGKESRELEPLIAHELIHIRRGDLWWALLQSLATSLWWFHPLIRVAGRMVTLESERSCDEETVISLGCSPSAYARSLLDVLERKHLLQVAPALPGVRPVDVTLKRVERIMKLGQGSHQRTPRWVWCLLMVGCAVALPSAAVSRAQEQDPQVAPVPKAEAKVAGAFVNMQYDIGDLLDLLIAQQRSEEQAKGLILSQLPQRSEGDLGTVASDQGLIGELRIPPPTPQIIGRELQFFTTKEHADDIQAALTRLRKSKFEQITCEVKFISLARTEFEQIAKDWPKTQMRTEAASAAESRPRNDVRPFVLASSIATAGESLSSKRVDSNPIHTRTNSAGLNKLLQQPSVNCISAPRIVTNSGQEASISMRNEKPYFPHANPKCWEDTKIDLCSEVAEHSKIDLTFDFTVSHTPMHAETTEHDTKSQTCLQFTLNGLRLASGESLVVGGLCSNVDADEKILLVCVTPVLGGIALSHHVEHKPLFTSKEPGDARLTVLGPTTSESKPAAYVPLSEHEVLHAIEMRRKETGEQRLTKRTFTKTALKKISEKIDPARFVPLIGNAELHHTLYECTLTYAENEGLVDTIYIDHVHFHLIDQPNAK